MMAKAALEKAVCEKCGAEVRENTLFCYNCGHKFSEAVEETNGSIPVAGPDETQSALDDLAARLKLDEAENADRIKVAAIERKKARVATPKRQKEEAWEQTEGRSGGALFVISLLIFLMVAAIVFFTVIWK